MSLLRFAARSLLASYFVVNGVKAVRHPADFAATAQPVADTVVPGLKAVLPAEAAALLPSEATGVARTCGVLQIVGGIGLATGAGRRISAGLLATTLVPSVVVNNPLKADAADRERFGADVALLGGVVLAALDTEGEPDLAWRLQARRRRTARHAEQRKAEAARTAKALTGRAAKRAAKLGKQAEGALS